MKGFVKAGATVQLTPVNARVGARVELKLDVSMMTQMPDAMRAKAMLMSDALRGKVDGTLLGWTYHGAEFGDAPMDGFTRIRMDNAEFGQNDIPFPMVLLKCSPRLEQTSSTMFCRLCPSCRLAPADQDIPLLARLHLQDLAF